MSKQNNSQTNIESSSEITIGQFIGQLMTEQSITVNFLAEKLDVSRQTVDYWRSGQSEPVQKRYKDIAEVLGISVEELVAQKRQPLENQAENRIKRS